MRERQSARAPGPDLLHVHGDARLSSEGHVRVKSLSDVLNTKGKTSRLAVRVECLLAMVIMRNGVRQTGPLSLVEE